MIPMVAEASLLSFLGLGTSARAQEVGPVNNSQTVPLADAHGLPLTRNSDTAASTSLATTDGTAVESETGPLGTSSDVEDTAPSPDINIYVVHSGDTVPAIAKMFDVSPDSIYWSNNLPRGSKLKNGDTLLIPSVTGVIHTVEKGETIASLAKKFKVSIQDVMLANELSSGEVLVPGTDLIIPDAKVDAPKPASRPTTSRTPDTTSTPKTVPGGYFLRPIAGGVRTQGRHGEFCGNEVDLAAPVGTPVFATASGIVTLARDSGWNGGAGHVVIISHQDIGARSVYAHLEHEIVSVGQSVSKGEVIGYLGNTGHSTGPHLHFGICGAVNPLVSNARYGL